MKGPILIQGAMDVECHWLRDKLADRKETVIGDYPFWSGRLGSREAVVSRTGIGELHAACAALLGIGQFQPGAVVNLGVAGAHVTDLHVGDVVLGEQVVRLDAWEAPPRGAGRGSDPFAWIPGEAAGVWDSDPALVDRLAGALPGTVRQGRLGSGDLFSREADRIRWLRDRCGHLCEDMESAGSAFACRQMGVPWVGVRIISNNELTGEAYRREVGEDLQRLLLEALDRMP